MTYTICYRLWNENEAISCFPHIEQLEFENDDYAKYYAITHRELDREPDEWLRKNMEIKLEYYDTRTDFVFWILREDDQKYIYKNPIEEDLKWYLKGILLGGKI